MVWSGVLLLMFHFVSDFEKVPSHKVHLHMESTRSLPGFHMDSRWTPEGLLKDSTWTPDGLLKDSAWTPCGLWVDSAPTRGSV